MAEGGTLLQLQYLINRTNIPSKVKKDVNAAQDFFETVVIAHVVAAAMQFFNMKTVQDKPASAIFSQLLAEDNIESRKKLFHSALVGMVRNFLKLLYLLILKMKKLMTRLGHMLKRYSH